MYKRKKKKRKKKPLFSYVFKCLIPIYISYIFEFKYIYQLKKITSSKTNPLPHVKITHSYPIFECLIPISIGYLFEFKYLNYVLGFFHNLSSSFCLKLRTLSLSYF